MGQEKPQIQPAKIKSIAGEVRYPIGLMDFEYFHLNPDGSPDPNLIKIRLILSKEEAETIGMHFLKLSQTISEMGGSKQ